jgi:pyrroloquinoline-quinone synthase
MNNIENLHTALDKLHLLKHEFYQAWSEGKLSKETLQEYAKQYYHHVEAFPRYISTIHSQCDDISSRQVLLGNLTEEEKGEENHPELWLRFSESLGVTREEVKNVTKLDNTNNLIEGFFQLARTSYAKGLGALYAYERQVPEIAKSKIAGLKEFYNIISTEGLKFFNVHITADEWHSEECLGLIEKLSPEDQEEAFDGAIEGARLLWKFLDGVHTNC